jgi:hypothetical protein
MGREQVANRVCDVHAHEPVAGQTSALQTLERLPSDPQIRTVGLNLGHHPGQEQGRSGTSLEAQRDEIARWARANDHPAPAFYSEIESGSAARTEARVELARLTSEARPGDVVVVCAVDRWSRDIVHAVASVRARRPRSAMAGPPRRDRREHARR